MAPTNQGSNSPFSTLLFPKASPFTRTTADGQTVSSVPSFWNYFPVSFRSGPFREKIEIVRDDKTLYCFLTNEFSLRRLDAIHGKLWRVGFQRPPRPLSTQVQLGRAIVLTHALDMHLVWDGSKIFLKPLPRYLLEPEFWTQHALQTDSSENTACRSTEKPWDTAAVAPAVGTARSTSDMSSPPSSSDIRKSALGLLYTYACLITHPADLQLALEHGLLPSDADSPIDWPIWRKFASEILHPNNISQIHRRFRHSELRLGRLNWIYVFKDVPAFEMYYNPWYSYTDFMARSSTWVTAATVYTVYVAVVLTALQVGLTTKKLQDNEAFNQASYGFTLFAILSPIISVVLLGLALLVALVPNFIKALHSGRSSKAPSPVDMPSRMTSQTGNPVWWSSWCLNLPVRWTYFPGCEETDQAWGPEMMLPEVEEERQWGGGGRQRWPGPSMAGRGWGMLFAMVDTVSGPRTSGRCK